MSIILFIFLYIIWKLNWNYKNYIKKIMWNFPSTSQLGEPEHPSRIFPHERQNNVASPYAENLLKSRSRRQFLRPRGMNNGTTGDGTSTRAHFDSRYVARERFCPIQLETRARKPS